MDQSSPIPCGRHLGLSVPICSKLFNNDLAIPDMVRIVRKWSRNVRISQKMSENCQEMVQDGQDMVWNAQGKAQNCLEMVRKWSEMIWNGLHCLKWSNIVQDGPIWFNTVHNGPWWSEVVHDSLKWSNTDLNGPRWFMMVQDGLKWPEKVQDGPTWYKIPRGSKMLEALEVIQWAYVRPERRRRESWRQNKETHDHPPHFYSLLFFLCTFHFSLFKSFHIAR